MKEKNPSNPRNLGLATVAAASLLSALSGQAALKDNIVAYWPLDEVVGTKTPDLVSGYDMELVNLTAADLVEGKRGKAFKFENARQTMLKRVNSAGEQLPINQFPALTISFWANVTGTGNSDLRLFSEGNTADNNPLFNLGTANTGNDNSLDLFFRQTGWTDVNHLRSVGQPLDGTWRHITFVQEADGTRVLYVDGVKDDVEIPAKEAGDWRLNTTTIGGILRANPTHWVNGLIDDVAMWNRALTPAEVTQLVNEGLVSVFPPLAKGMVAYWPLDDVFGVKTPDLVNGYDMELVNLTAADFVAGKRGKAVNLQNARQTMLKRVNAVGELLPINQHEAITISFWANVTGTGQTDLRLFSEGSTSNNDPLFNLGTASTGATGQLDVFLRRSGWTTVDHIKSEGEPLDGTWRHIVFVQGADGTRALYFDGVKDPLEIPAKVAGAWNVNTTTIGGILRANPTHWVTGQMDDVALWNRALSEAEIKSVYTDGTPVPFSKPQPLAIRSFRADLPAVAVGDSVWLRWDVSKNVQVSIDQGVGDVTAQTVSGLGAVQVALTASKAFTLTLSRGSETLSSQVVNVAAIDGVAAGWTLIDNFDRYPAGLLNGQSAWKDMDAVDFVLADVGGNTMVGANAGDATASLPLGPLTVKEGQQSTLFFRLYQAGDPAEAAKGMVALSDRNVRFGSDVGGAGNDIGPGAVASTELGVGLQLGGANGNGAAVEFYEPILEPLTVYNVWVDIRNGPFPEDQSSTGDTYSIHVAKEGTAARTTILTDYTSARGQGQADVGFATKDLDKVILGGLNGTSTTTNLFFDDLYLSKSGYLATVPRKAGMTTPVPGTPPSVAIARAGAQVQVTFAGGSLQSADTAVGPWSDVAGASSPLTVPASGVARFYRVRQ
jgi:hypothetical protein